MAEYTIRDAEAGDIDTLVAFNVQEALEAENIQLDPPEARRGVVMAFEDARLARYWVAVAPDGRIAGSVSVVTEWSNYHGGHYWWIQSIFIVPEHRGGGLVERLLDHVGGAAQTSGALDLRLHVYAGNERAQRAYRRCGFEAAPYTVMIRTR